MSTDPVLDLESDAATLTQALVDIYSESGHEAALADAVQEALTAQDWLTIERNGDAVVARTTLGRRRRVVLGGHLDTVPPADNLPARWDDRRLVGLGSCDMKGGVAVMLRLAAHLRAPACDLTFVFYDNEEVADVKNGMGRLARERPELLDGDFAVLLEPTNGVVEGGCQGSLTVEVTAAGQRAHAARSWQGSNAIHAAGPVLQTLADYDPRRPLVDGYEFREGLNAVRISGGVANNVVPDSCIVTVNYRFAPDRSVADAESHLRSVFAGHELDVVDAAAGARPGLDSAPAQALVAATGGTARVKLGWTDVARFAGLGVPAVNFGPGDPAMAHRSDEWVDADQIEDCERHLTDWLSGTWD